MNMAEISPKGWKTVWKKEKLEQFLLFPQCFQKTCTADTLKPGLIWESVKGNQVSDIKYTT